MSVPKISFIDFLKYVRIYNKETGELINFNIKDVENKLKILKNGRKKKHRTRRKSNNKDLKVRVVKVGEEYDHLSDWCDSCKYEPNK